MKESKRSFSHPLIWLAVIVLVPLCLLKVAEQQHPEDQNGNQRFAIVRQEKSVDNPGLPADVGVVTSAALDNGKTYRFELAPGGGYIEVALDLHRDHPKEYVIKGYIQAHGVYRYLLSGVAVPGHPGQVSLLLVREDDSQQRIWAEIG